MKNGNASSASERAVALINEALEALQRAEKAPDSPVTTFAPLKLRRQLRRRAEMLRRGKAQPRYGNLHSAEQLADIYERTVRRDEMFERHMRDFKGISRK